MKKRIIALIILIIGLFLITTYTKKRVPIYINFENDIKNISSLTTKEDIYLLEDKKTYKTETTDLYNIVVYNNKNINGYVGTLRYGFDENNLLKAINFEFKNKSDYKTFLKNFKEKYSPSIKKESGYEVWEGYLKYDIIFLATYDQGNSIDLMFIEKISMK